MYSLLREELATLAEQQVLTLHEAQTLDHALASPMLDEMLAVLVSPELREKAALALELLRWEPDEMPN